MPSRRFARLVALLAAFAPVLLSACDADAPAGGPVAGAVTADGSSAGLAGDASATAGADGTVAAQGDSGLPVAATQTCPPKLAGCVGKDRVVCNDAGTEFALVPCPTGLHCVEGACMECDRDEDCKAGLECKAAKCTLSQLALKTTTLPPGLVGMPYAATLEAKGGVLPYAWSVAQGSLPSGVLLDKAGKLGGAPTVAGSASFQVQVEDAQGLTATAILVLEVGDGGLVIKTVSPLKAATEGEAYTLSFEAQGGKAPYFWGLKGGALPADLGLSASGVLSGIPTEDGSFSFDLKVLDDSAPALMATKTLTLPVKLAPLEIVGSQQVDLFVTKIIVLPLIIVVDEIPVPYSAQLQAKGGKKPYHWAEVAMPGLVKTFIPKSGVPQGLKIAEDGAISGSVTDASLVVNVKVPLTQLALTGFFFSAEVKDSQSKPEKKTALFIIPTVPIGGP